jgi:uncharacterized protein (DUF488 family)
MISPLYTIGHSNHSSDAFMNLLKIHKITALADVRSTPYSRHQPQFNREHLQNKVQQVDINYVYLGEELGARSKNQNCYHLGKVQFDLLAREPSFLQGFERVRKGMENHRVALMCAEKDPLECHRTILIGRHFSQQGIELLHILADGTLEKHENTEKRLLLLFNLPEGDLFNSRDKMLEEAYNLQADRIAFVDKNTQQV